VLDNGVTSSEYWKILDADEQLQWAVFQYVGAASAAGQSYTGALLVTPSGEWPTDPSANSRMEAALAQAQIQSWEMYMVREHPPRTEFMLLVVLAALIR
jgi:hypothetical protein